MTDETNVVVEETEELEDALENTEVEVLENEEETSERDPYEDPAVVEDMKARYTAVETDEERKAVVEELCKELGKPVASVRGKLVSEKVYIKPGKTTKTGGKVVRKNELADRIAAFAIVLGYPMAENDVDSLTKASKLALTALVNMFETVHNDMELLRAGLDEARGTPAENENAK